MLPMLTALLLAPAADTAAMEKALKAALPDGWAFVSGRIAQFGGHHAKTCWLATLEAKKAGDYYLAATMNHAPKAKGLKAEHTICRYHLGVGKAGTKRSVADPFALPQCNEGDRLVIPILAAKGDTGHAFTFTTAEKRPRWHTLGHECRERVMGQKDEKPAFKVRNKDEKNLRLVAAKCYRMSPSRDGGPPFSTTQEVTLEAVKPGKLAVRAPVEVVAADAKVTAWVGVWDQSRLREKPAAGDESGKGGTHGYEFAGPLAWTMRVGDRIKVTFPATVAGRREAPVPDLMIPEEAFALPIEPYPSWR